MRKKKVEKKRRDETNLVPNFIKEWRELRGYPSQMSLATAAGLSPNTVHRLESFTLAYTPYTLDALANVLKCSAGDLVSVDPTKSADILRVWQQTTESQHRIILKYARSLIA